MRFSSLLLLFPVLISAAHAADYPKPSSGTHVLHDFHFASGEVLPDLRIHYRTLGEPRRDQNGVVRNAVLILHGTTGSGANSYAIESSADYAPGPGLEQIRAPLLAINFADDLINPPELGVLEKEIGRVKRGKAIPIPRSDRTRSHGTHTLAAVWKEHLIRLLQETEK